MVDKERLVELAERCEKATAEQQRELLLEAFETLTAAFVATPSAIKFVRMLDAEAYESAAMTLVPEWAKLHFLQDTEYDNPAEKTWSANLRAREEKAREPGFGSEWQSWCATPALALCAAALRARASIQKGDGDEE